MAKPGADPFLGGSELARLMRDFDWGSTSLGAPARWPQSLKTAVRIMLTSRQPIWIGWGEELVYLYNDPYMSIIGGRHPWALGRPTREVWREIWEDIGPLLAEAMTGDEGTYVESQLLVMERNGYPEETYYTFSYSPIPNDDGTAGGIICANTDDTQRVIGERQLALLRVLAADTAEARNLAEACERSVRALESDPLDLPFAALYILDPDHRSASLAGLAGISGGHAAFPPSLPLNGGGPGGWPLAEALRSADSQVVEDLAAYRAEFPRGPWTDAPDKAVVLPVAAAGERGSSGFLVAGLNPYRMLNDDYEGFLNLVAGQIAAAIANAEAYAQERRRAEALAEIDQAKTAFFSNVSHEFRTPLTLMLGTLEELLAKEADGAGGETRALVSVAHRNGVRLLKLVNALLDFSRIEAGRVQGSFEVVDLSRLTAELASNFASAVEKAGLRLSVDAKALPPPVHVDRDMWEKIVLNLLSNAFKFTFEGEIAVMVRPSADGRHVEVVVSDTGTGIPPGELPRIFERFRRVEGAQGRSFEGSGIGLALVQELVKLHGGDIRVESEVGRGTAFTVTLPFGTAHLPADRIGGARSDVTTGLRAQAYVDEALSWLADAAAGDGVQPATSEDLAGIASIATGSDLLLVADDNADMRNYVARLLSSAGFRVETVADGEAAVEAARRLRPSLVLSDVMMPKLDGFGLLAALRSEEDLRSVPVLLLSARAGEDEKVVGLESGADDYLVKPFSARELLARVQANLRLSRVRRQTELMLETKVAERTRELDEAIGQLRQEAEEREKAEVALRQAQKMEGIGRLTGGVAHDFNNLLTVIIGNLDGLVRQAQNGDIDRERVERAAGLAMRGARRAEALTQRLLAFSRQQPLDPRPVDIGRLVTGMSDLLRRSIGEEIAVETVLTGGLWRSHVDSNQLEVAILNLAVNSRDAMKEGGRLTIETANVHLDERYAVEHAEVSPGQYVMLAVSDTGCGMTKEIIAQAFEPFFTTKEIGHGTGLGLSQVYGFVKQSGGHVKIYSEVEAGTTVKLYFPRLHSDESPATEEPVSPTVKGSGSETILVVEDDDDVRAYTTETLHELGYDVLQAPNGHAALKLIDQHPEIHLLFTDIGLPGGMNGRKLSEEARKRRRDLKVLFTSGYARNAIVHDGRLDPGVELITKPFTQSVLSTKLRDMLDTRLRPARILVVEDEVLLQMLAVDTLEEAGYAVEVAGSATEAMNKVRLIPGGVDAVVVDIGLPDRRGDQLVGELRAIYPSLPIIIASGQDDASLRRQFEGAGSLAITPKPYTPKMLVDSLHGLGVR